jgi:hypothetical protein
MKALTRDTKEEAIIDLEYKVKRLSLLIGILSEHLGKEKVIELCREGNYPKTDEQVKQLAESKVITKEEIILLTEMYNTCVGSDLSMDKNKMDWIRTIVSK